MVFVRIHFIFIMFAFCFCYTFYEVCEEPELKYGNGFCLSHFGPSIDSCDFVYQLEKFRGYVLTSDSQKLKQYISFPLKEKSVWYLVNLFRQNTPVRSKLLFEEGDFVMYFDDIFNDDFKNSFADVSFPMLLDRGKHTTESYEGFCSDNKERYYYRLLSKHEKGSNNVEFTLLYEFIDDGYKYETSVTYHLEFVSCVLKIDKIFVIN